MRGCVYTFVKLKMHTYVEDATEKRGREERERGVRVRSCSDKRLVKDRDHPRGAGPRRREGWQGKEQRGRMAWIVQAGEYAKRSTVNECNNSCKRELAVAYVTPVHPLTQRHLRHTRLFLLSCSASTAKNPTQSSVVAMKTCAPS